MCRPKFPLTDGHFAIRLNDPSIAFDAASAADLLHCYRRLRRVLAALVGASGAQLYMALNWQPVGDSIGEPLAETSTPTLHAFFDWPGGTTAAAALSLPAHERVAVADIAELDGTLRRRLAGDNDRVPLVLESPPNEGGTPGDPRAFRIEPSAPAPGQPFRGGHWTAAHRNHVKTLDEVAPLDVLELARSVEGLRSHSRPQFSGLTLWAVDVWNASTPATVNIFGRRHGDTAQLVAGFVTSGGLGRPATSVPRSPTLEG
ncbi:MAG: hypothetical protein WBX27_14780 [Specibacter sp.]